MNSMAKNGCIVLTHNNQLFDSNKQNDKHC